jgi:hypothetical protein
VGAFVQGQDDLARADLDRRRHVQMQVRKESGERRRRNASARNHDAVEKGVRSYQGVELVDERGSVARQIRMDAENPLLLLGRQMGREDF